MDWLQAISLAPRTQWIICESKLSSCQTFRPSLMWNTKVVRFVTPVRFIYRVLPSLTTVKSATAQ